MIPAQSGVYHSVLARRLAFLYLSSA
uniref:Uncharacterized protein n=1 Tax=Heterorhabditis bacteriophora TaxID=37862 RepID=A0A1I7W6P5_HETBA